MAERFLIMGIGGVYNYGCQAIMRGTVEMLRNEFPGCEIRYASMAPEYDRPALADLDLQIWEARPRVGPHRIFRKGLRSLGLPWRHIRDFPSDMYKDLTAAFSIGGDTFTPHAVGFQWEELWIEREVMKDGTPVVQWSATIGPFETGSEVEVEMKSFLRDCLLVTAREDRTVQYLQSIGITDNVVRVADAAFIVEPEEFDLAPLLPKNRGDYLIGVNFTPQLEPYLNEADGKSIVDHGVECIRALLDQTNCSVVCFGHVVHYSPQDGSRIAREIVDRLGDTTGRVTTLPADLGMRKTKHAVQCCDAIVTGRMHCSIAALTTCTPVIVISYSMKTHGVFNDIFGHSDWLLPLDELAPDTFVKSICKILEARQDVRSHLAEIIPNKKEQSRLAGTALRDALMRAGRI